MEKDRIPRHIAIIPDGNRRWARKKGLVASAGHYRAGSYENIKSLFVEGQRLGVKYMSLWGFSTENWVRGDSEIDKIFRLIHDNVTKFREDAHKDKMRFRHIGRKDRLPQKLAKAITRLEEETKKYDTFHVQLCLDYGGRDELIRAFNTMLKEGKETIDEESFYSYLDTQDIPQPDLIIRTGGEQRVSGFMLYQSAYSELYFTDTLFPDFGPNQLKSALEDYSKRRRRYGGD